MRSLILIGTLLLAMISFTACDKEKVKVKAAVKVEEAVEKELTEAYEGVVIEGYSCAEEVEVIGDKVYEKVAELLKIEKERSSMVQSFAASDLKSTICLFVGQKVLPDLVLGGPGDEYRCLRYVGSEGIKKVTFKLCGSL